jgi:hypothetical protein
MPAKLQGIVFSLLRKISWLLVFCGILLGRTAEARSIDKRVAAVQKAVQDLPPAIREPFTFRAQWGNWGNWRNWNNWANWANWNNWNNWGNWRNF